MSATTLLLCTDMDRTVIPNDSHPEDPRARPYLHRLARRDDVCLVYVSGRDIGLVEQAIADFALPQPTYVISDVGTCIHQWHQQGWRPNEDWAVRIASDWAGMTGWELMPLLIDPLRTGMLSGLPDIAPQEAERQNRFKVSFYTGLTLEQRLLDRLSSDLEAAGLHSNLVWSIDEPAQRGLLDVLPASASKLHAIRYLQAQLGLADEQVLFAGDSGNDMEVLVSNINSVLVRNASAHVRETVLRRVRENGTEHSLYLAVGTTQSGMNGNYAAGVIEGVMHFVPAMRAFLLQETSRDRSEQE